MVRCGGECVSTVCPPLPAMLCTVCSACVVGLRRRAWCLVSGTARSPAVDRLRDEPALDRTHGSKLVCLCLRWRCETARPANLAASFVWRNNNIVIS
eukprot:2781028-Prymnesium_polylepis.1